MATSSLPAHLADMLDPRFYHHPVTAIQVVETHISWVVLTGEFVYKIKKDVRLPFLDFSSLAKRKHYCEEELRLNRRYAPEIYLSLVSITQQHSAIALDGDGKVIEYAIKMHQFDRQGQFDHCIARGSITLKHMDTLAENLARIHDSLPSTPEDSSFGNLSSIKQAALENFSTLHELVHDNLALTTLSQVNAWTNQFCDTHRDLFDERKANGFIRECHGDLHLGNITLIDGAPVIFDCIEFNEEFRWIDVINDLAFLIMDLHRLQRPDMAQHVLNHYLEITGDYRGLRLMRFYLVYRAMVRCKVAAITAQQHHELDSDKRYQDYLNLALKFTHPACAHLLITHGLSGSGKSILSQMLVDHSESIRVRSDVERKRLFGLTALASSSAEEKAELYSSQANENTYQRLKHCAEDILAANYSAIIDATFIKAQPRKTFHDLARQLGVNFVIISTTAPVAQLRAWVLARQQAGKDASEATLDILEKQIATAEELDADEKQNVVTVATDEPIDTTCVLAAIDAVTLKQQQR